MDSGGFLAFSRSSYRIPHRFPADAFRPLFQARLRGCPRRLLALSTYRGSPRGRTCRIKFSKSRIAGELPMIVTADHCSSLPIRPIRPPLVRDRSPCLRRYPPERACVEQFVKALPRHPGGPGLPWRVELLCARPGCSSRCPILRSRHTLRPVGGASWRGLK